MWNSTTGTVFFENIQGIPLNNFKSFYNEFKYFGKHFKIRSTKNMLVHRHYTICKTMQPEMYNGLLDCLKTS